ncbi:MAG TPA: hypothetical protein VFM48_08280, partial [Aquabacterium sp.]|nr:hypothetical protein [Aquabacterium sp.]
LVKDAKLKKRAKSALRSAYATSVGWWKVSWQENRRTDPLIQNQLKDTQDNIDRLQVLRQGLDEPGLRDSDLQLAQLREAMEGLNAQAEVVVSRGLVVDFCMSEDVLVLDDAIRALTDYDSSSAMAHRSWMTKEKYLATFGYAPQKAKAYREQPGTTVYTESNTSADQRPELYCVWEIWDQDANRVYTICDGEEGFCKPPASPNWTGKRWYPFFCFAFNEVDGRFYPMSDVYLTDPLVREYNDSRDDLVSDRKDCRPVNIVRKGGALTDGDINRIRNRDGMDIVMVEGVGGRPLSDDIFIGSMGRIDPQVYDTSPARADIERLIGGGDASTGSIRDAKTATEAEILSQGLRGRSQERQDTIEDMLSEVGQYAIEVMLRRMTEEEVKAIAGDQAQWPAMNIEQIFNSIQIEVRGGSTGRPDRLQEQDRWTKLLPVIKEAMQQVSQLRKDGQESLAQAVIALTRETLRRFDERLDIEQFLPAPSEGQQDPAQLLQQIGTMKQQVQMLMQELEKLKEAQEKDYIAAAVKLATSPNPGVAVPTFMTLMQAAATGQVPDMGAFNEAGEGAGGGQQTGLEPGELPEAPGMPENAEPAHFEPAENNPPAPELEEDPSQQPGAAAPQ